MGTDRKNPCIYATVPKHKSKKREIWTAETLMHALEVCDNDRLRLSLNLSFSCSLRIGELLGLTWDCIDISPEAIEENRAYVYVNKELQRVTKEALKELDGKDVLLVFPEKSKINKTVRILKTPKTETSVRKIFLPKSVAIMLKVNMVTDVYSHILDDDRKKNAELFEDAFYGKKETDPQMHRKKPENTLKVPDGVDAELLAKVLSNPEMATLLASLAKTIK